MTTIACNRKEMAADTRVTWEGVGADQYTGLKLFPVNGSIYGITGEDCTGSMHALKWFRDGCMADFRPAPPEYEHSWDWKILELSRSGISLYNVHLERESVEEPCIAVGSGRKVAMYCMRFLKMSPAQAVREACKVDMWSAPPIYVSSLSDPTPRRWDPARKSRRKK